MTHLSDDKWMTFDKGDYRISIRIINSHKFCHLSLTFKVDKFYESSQSNLFQGRS